MSALKITGIVVLVLGLAGLAYGQFSYTKDTHTAEIGSIKMSVQDTKQVEIPTWVSVVAVALGGAMLFAPIKR